MFLSKFFKNHLTIPQATDLFEEVKSQTHPDIADLKRLVGFHKAPVGTKEEMQALDLKYHAMTHVPTVIEKTMSPFQLYQARNPLWKQNLSGYNISCVKYGQKKFDNENLILTENDFKVLSCCEDTYTVNCHVEYRLKNRKD